MMAIQVGPMNTPRRPKAVTLPKTPEPCVMATEAGAAATISRTALKRLLYPSPG
jgi:hypothetical protein